MVENAQEMLGLLVDHELAVKDLYTAYAGVFADVGSFWHALAGDEQSHADRLGLLGTDPSLDLWLDSEARRKAPAVISSIDYLRAEALRARSGQMALVQALAVAKDVEEALIDRQFLFLDSPGCTAISEVLAELREETEMHRQVVADALETEKRLHH
jgi:hypothetical protein